MFICQKCNYKSSNKSNFNKHLKSIKHTKNNITPNNKEIIPQLPPKSTKIHNYLKKLRCEYCDKEFSRIDSLHRHQKNCKKIDKLDEKDKKIHELEIKMKDDKIDSLKEQLKYQKELTLSAGTIADKAITSQNQTLKFLNTYFCKAPPLEGFNKSFIINYALGCISDKSFNEDEIEEYNDFDDFNEESDEIKEKIGSFLFTLYLNKLFVNEMSELIVKYYKKEEEEQSIWSTDCSRKNFYIRVKKIIKSKEDKEIKTSGMEVWLFDPVGENVKNIIIRPLLECVDIYLIAYQQILIKRNLEHSSSLSTTQIVGNLEIIQKIAQFSLSIHDKVSEKELLKNIAPKLHLKFL